MSNFDFDSLKYKRSYLKEDRTYKKKKQSLNKDDTEPYQIALPTHSETKSVLVFLL